MNFSRRKFMPLLAGTAAAWPMAARGQQAAMPVIGVIGSGPAGTTEYAKAPFLQGLRDGGYDEGRNVDDAGNHDRVGYPHNRLPR